MNSVAPPVAVGVDGHPVRASNPGTVAFWARGETELDLINDYVAVGDDAPRGAFESPTVLKRFPDGEHRIGAVNFGCLDLNPRPGRTATGEPRRIAPRAGKKTA